MSKERVEIIESIQDHVDDDTRRLFAMYVRLHERYVELTGTELADEGVSFDRLALTTREARREADIIAARMRGLIAITCPNL